MEGIAGHSSRDRGHHSTLSSPEWTDKHYAQGYSSFAGGPPTLSRNASAGQVTTHQQAHAPQTERYEASSLSREHAVDHAGAARMGMSVQDLKNMTAMRIAHHQMPGKGMSSPLQSQTSGRERRGGQGHGSQELGGRTQMSQQSGRQHSRPTPPPPPPPVNSNVRHKNSQLPIGSPVFQHQSPNGHHHPPLVLGQTRKSDSSSAMMPDHHHPTHSQAQHQQQRGIHRGTSLPRMYSSPGPEETVGSPVGRFAHGLSVEELKEMTKLRLQHIGRSPPSRAGSSSNVGASVYDRGEWRHAAEDRIEGHVMSGIRRTSSMSVHDAVGREIGHVGGGRRPFSSTGSGRGDISLVLEDRMRALQRNDAVSPRILSQPSSPCASQPGSPASSACNSPRIGVAATQPPPGFGHNASVINLPPRSSYGSMNAGHAGDGGGAFLRQVGSSRFASAPAESGILARGYSDVAPQAPVGVRSTRNGSTGGSGNGSPSVEGVFPLGRAHPSLYDGGSLGSGHAVSTSSSPIMLGRNGEASEVHERERLGRRSSYDERAVGQWAESNSGSSHVGQSGRPSHLRINSSSYSQARDPSTRQDASTGDVMPRSFGQEGFGVSDAGSATMTSRRSAATRDVIPTQCAEFALLTPKSALAHQAGHSPMKLWSPSWGGHGSSAEDGDVNSKERGDASVKNTASGYPTMNVQYDNLPRTHSAHSLYKNGPTGGEGPMPRSDAAVESQQPTVVRDGCSRESPFHSSERNISPIAQDGDGDKGGSAEELGNLRDKSAETNILGGSNEIAGTSGGFDRPMTSGSFFGEDIPDCLGMSLEAEEGEATLNTSEQHGSSSLANQEHKDSPSSSSRAGQKMLDDSMFRDSLALHNDDHAVGKTMLTVTSGGRSQDPSPHEPSSSLMNGSLEDAMQQQLSF